MLKRYVDWCCNNATENPLRYLFFYAIPIVMLAPFLMGLSVRVFIWAAGR